jgi:hypothetical protein
MAVEAAVVEAWGRRAQDESSVAASRTGRVTRERIRVIVQKKAE